MAIAREVKIISARGNKILPERFREESWTSDMDFTPTVDITVLDGMASVWVTADEAEEFAAEILAAANEARDGTDPTFDQLEVIAPTEKTEVTE